jgi:hypothetical protein
MKNKALYNVATIIGLMFMGVLWIGGAVAYQEKAMAEQSAKIAVPVGQWEITCENGSTPTIDGLTVSCDELPTSTATDTETPIPTDTETPTPTDTATPEPSNTPTVTASNTSTPSNTPTFEPSNTPTFESPSNTPAPQTPYPGAPLCTDHNNNTFHTLWNAAQGCHYDHEHGTNPFTPQVAGAFPGFDTRALLGNVEIGHTNPSSPMENTHKHGGMKWQVSTNAPQGCAVGFEGGTVAVDAYAIQYHAFGQQSVEFEARNHSSAALLRQCKASNPADKGYIYVVQLQEYGERVMPYQGTVLPYPDNFQPLYDGSFGPYFTTECFGNDITVGGKFIDCRPTFDNPNNNLTIWTSKRTGPVSQPRPVTSSLFRLLFRGRDAYQRLDITDLSHPFTWRFVCGGVTYNPAGCRYNNTTTTIHEIAGDIPAAWDGLANFDTDPRVGRVTFTGFVTATGALAPTCTTAGGSCYPIKLVNAFVGRYSSEISVNKVSNPTPLDTPERDICFTSAGALAVCDTAGAVPSGWVGAEN